jgi:hypothetical protein
MTANHVTRSRTVPALRRGREPAAVAEEEGRGLNMRASPQVRVAAIVLVILVPVIRFLSAIGTRFGTCRLGSPGSRGQTIPLPSRQALGSLQETDARINSEDASDEDASRC